MSIVLGIHNILRWLVLAAVLFALFRMVRGLITRPSWTKTDRLAGLLVTITIDVQLLLGLILYFVMSPMIKTFFADISAAWQNSTLRFFGIEHILLMAAAAVTAHLGGNSDKKPIPDERKFKQGLIFFAITFVLLMLGIPWMRALWPTF